MGAPARMAELDPAEFHPLLRRQLRRHFGTWDAVPAGLRPLFREIDRAYREADRDRLMLERSLELSSEELTQAAGELRLLLGAFPDLVFRVDADGAVREVVSGRSSGLYAWLFRGREPVGRRLVDLLPEECAARFAQAAAGLTGRQGVGAVGFEFDSIGGEFGARSLEARLVPLPGGQCMAIVRDITDRVEAERARDRARNELRERDEQLRQAQKLEAIGRLAGGIAHDFNNLLTAILATCGLLVMDLEPDDPRRQDVEELTDLGRRAAALIRQLLAFSRQQVLRPQLLDLNEVVLGLERLVRRLLGEDVIVRTELEPEVWPIFADCSQIEQVLVNLVVNARDAMPRGGELTIATRNRELGGPGAPAPVGLAAGPYVELIVQDTGCGMDAETMARIFDPFFTTKGPEKGTGLGLSTVYGIVRQSGGAIEVESAPGQGARFRILLPRAAHGVQAPGQQSSQHEDLPRGTETVLLVEDDAAVRSLVHKVLDQCGYRVLVAEDAARALQIAAAEHGGIELLLTDVIMPRTSGPELAGLLRAMQPALRVLFISGYTGDRMAEHGLDQGEVELLAKPFSPAALARRVRAVLDAPRRPGPGPEATASEQQLRVQR
ncbi:MAG: hypothetical protein KatS3mg102_2474 [Planctomycetota bacterium]|nr:MAG: hypothetical protein KatS3mg102_2474 [Planctomycetota bacterium]